MKVLTKDQEDRHYTEVLKGGAVGGVIGLGLGWAGVALGGRRYAMIRNLTLPFKSFLISSAATFGLIIQADRASMAYQRATNPMYGYRDEASKIREQLRANQSTYDKAMVWGRENRYSIVFGSWVASMAASWAMVNRSKAMTAAQKLVQARVYAQGLTVAVLMITAVFEMRDAKHGSGRWQTILVPDPSDPEHKLMEKKVHKEEYEGQDLWKGKRSPAPGGTPTFMRARKSVLVANGYFVDMVAAEEKRIQERRKQIEAENGKASA